MTALKATSDNVSNEADTTKQAIPRLAYNIDEAAQALGISKVSVYRLLERGLLKSSSALRHKVIPVSEIERFLKVTLQ